MSIKISVIIPCYNQKEYIKRAINSILNQDNNNYEIIIVDDGSTDEGLTDIKNINSDKIRIYRIKHQGVSIARNYGVSKSNYDIISFLDSDDEWLPEYISSAIKLINKYPNAAAYVMNNFIKNRGRLIIDNNNIKLNNKSVIIHRPFKFMLKYPTSITTSSVTIKKEIFNNLNGFKENVAWGEDQDLWYRLAIKYPIVFSNKINTIINITGNWSDKLYERIHKTPEHPFIESGLIALKNTNINSEDKVYIKDMVEKLKLQSAKHNMQIGKFQTAKKILLNCDNSYYWNKKFYLSWINLPDFILRTGKHNLFNIYSRVRAYIKSCVWATLSPYYERVVKQ